MNDDIWKKYEIQMSGGRRTKTIRSLHWGNFIKNLQKETEYYKQLAQELETEKDARPNISLIDWNNDYSKRPTQFEFDKLKNELTNSQKDATSWKSVYELEKDKAKRLETDKVNLTNERNQLQTNFNQKQNKVKQLETEVSDLKEEWRKEVQSLKTERSQLQKSLTELENDKTNLTTNLNNKNIQLAQKENQLERTIKDFQEKEQTKHQEYLKLLTEKDTNWENKLKEALKKPPMVSVETQTELTAEQITQMEQELEYFHKLLREGADEIGKLENQSNQKETEINQLKEQVKDLEPNEDEKTILGYCDIIPWTINNLSYFEIVKKYIETGIKPNDYGWKTINLSQLRTDYEKIRQRLIERADYFLTIKQKEKELTTKNQELTKLQTKYDMEVRSKEELVREISVLRSKSIDNYPEKTSEVFYKVEIKEVKPAHRCWKGVYYSKSKIGTKDNYPLLEIGVSKLKYRDGKSVGDITYIYNN